ncbi:MAG: CotH kinase family protein [Oscillospiraceae bacterium]|nr:CotH kinase family protein [Oscillospiraceae bacterium]
MSEFRKPTAEEAEKYPQLTNLPALYITISDDISAITKDSYIPGNYTLVYGEEGGIYDGFMQIKGRGNYSWGLPKKPYTIKLAKAQSLLGMRPAEKWILTANYTDKTLLRNFLTFKLAIDTTADYSPDCRFVDLYVNGKYNGNYLLTEVIEIRDNKINIDEDTEGLFEIEASYRHDDHTYCIPMPSDNSFHIMYKEPSDNDILPELKLENLEKFKSFFTQVDASLSKGYDEYSKYIDVDSFVNWYIVNEFVKNFDSAFTSSCYCFIKDGKLHMGPVWDYDTCYGNQDIVTCMDPTGYHVNGSPWYGKLTKDETFKKLLCQRWTELRNDGIFENFTKRLSQTAEYISASEKKDTELWPDAMKSRDLRGKKSLYTYDDELQYLKDWVAARINWLDGEWYGK